MIYAFVAEKGGTGKTTLAYNLAVELSKVQKVLMIDLDAQRANLTEMAGVPRDENRLTSLEVIKGGVPIHKAIVSVGPGLDLVPANDALLGLEIEGDTLRSFRGHLEAMAGEYQTIIMDAPPAAGTAQFVALAVADRIIAPLLPDGACLQTFKAICASVNEVGEVNPGLRIAGAVINKNARSALYSQIGEALEEMAAEQGTKVYKTRIRQGVAIAEASFLHKGVCDYAPRSSVAGDIREFVREVRENG